MHIFTGINIDHIYYYTKAHVMLCLQVYTTVVSCNNNKEHRWANNVAHPIVALFQYCSVRSMLKQLVLFFTVSLENYKVESDTH